MVGSDRTLWFSHLPIMSHSPITAEGYVRALELLRQCATPEGFIASTTDTDNYRRVWGRDGVIMGLSALLTEDEHLHRTFLATLRTLRDHQGPHGEIPSNVDVGRGRVSLGGTTGRVDADLWFLIGCGAYYERTGDERFLEEFGQTIERVLFLLGCWEFNDRGLLYVPQTGDWTDEYIQQGYVLYDQALYYRALQSCATLLAKLHGTDDALLRQKTGRLKELIKANYWFNDCEIEDPHAYHPILHRKGCEAAALKNRHWMSFFSPTGYGYRFDAMANVLVSLFDIASDEQRDLVDEYIEQEVVQRKIMLLPAFHPVIDPNDEDWGRLQMSFSYSFKNKPYEFHNGGLWPFVTGFYAVDLARRGKTDLARRYLEGIDAANARDGREGGWGFYEFFHGQTHAPGGTKNQGWSAGASIMGHHALRGSFLFSS